MAGKHSGCMMWPGSDFEYKGKNCTFTMKLDKNVSFEERVDKAMSWFTHKETPVNLIMLYIEQPDAYSHVYGPESIQVSIIKRNFHLIGANVPRLYSILSSYHLTVYLYDLLEYSHSLFFI